MRRLTMLGVILSMGLIALLIVALPASANHLPGGAPFEIVDDIDLVCPTGFVLQVPQTSDQVAVDLNDGLDGNPIGNAGVCCYLRYLRRCGVLHRHHLSSGSRVAAVVGSGPFHSGVPQWKGGWRIVGDDRIGIH